MFELSVIVPIYNVEKYLERCIDSILTQTYTDFELILVNDGSPDRCAEIMERYAKKDRRIVTIYQENKGVSAARNAGLKIAQGKYISFIDPDDYVERGFFEEVIRLLEEKGVDIACCNWCSVLENGEKKEHLVNSIPQYMKQEEFVKHLFDTPRTIGGSNCNKIFLKEKIQEIYDENLKICEDNLFLINYCKNIEKAGYLNKPLYCIFERSNSATRNDYTKLTTGLEVREKIILISRNISRESGMYAEKDFLDSCCLYFKEFQREKDRQYSLYSLDLLRNYLKKNLFKVIFNSKIFWKTKILYFKICIVK